MSVGNQTNQNIYQPELLLWHWRLAQMGIQWVQALVWERNDLPAHVLTRTAKIRNYLAPLCVARTLTWHGTSTSSTTKVVTPSYFIRNSNDLLPGCRVSVDQHQSPFLVSYPTLQAVKDFPPV